MSSAGINRLVKIVDEVQSKPHDATELSQHFDSLNVIGKADLFTPTHGN